ncbi:MAG: hypothetical protein PHN57_03365 [Candidatus Omnitrophica bacterium]|nr:hypothetical protein [Candidatus Omnitrophota bacterium]
MEGDKPVNTEETLQEIKKEFHEARAHIEALLNLFREKEAQLNSSLQEMQAKNGRIAQLESQNQEFMRQYAESQWYLGEEKSRREQLNTAVDGYQKRCRELEVGIEQLRLRCIKLEKDLSDAQWYLGEERARIKQLESSGK